MGYVPTIAECRGAAIERCQISRSTTQYNNAEANSALAGLLKYALASNPTTTPFTGGYLKGMCAEYVSFIRPLAADYTANIGDRCKVLMADTSVSATAPYDAEEWMYTQAGWQKFMMGGAADLTSVVATSAGTMNNMWWANSATTGTVRTLSARQNLTGTGTEDGETIRAYNLISGTITGSSVHGIHSTLQLGSETVASTGASTGQSAGVRATIGTGLTNTAANLGTISALKVDSYFLTAATAATMSSLIYGCDVGTYGVKAFMQIGTMVLRQTAAANKALGPYTYVAGHITLGVCDGLLQVVTPDATLYIPLYSAAT